MLKKRFIPMILTLTASLLVLFATTVSQACWPWDAYQPKTPKSLIKED